MSTVQEGLQSQIRNIEKQYGKPLSAWVAIIKSSGKTKHNEVVAMLKSEYGMTHGSAHRVSLIARESSDAGSSETDLYAGPKATLKPIHDKLMDEINKFGRDIELAPKKGYLSLRRHKQFAMIQPTTNTRLDVGLILKDEPVSERLESAKSFNALFTHRVRLENIGDVDAQLIDWLRQAYAGADKAA